MFDVTHARRHRGRQGGMWGPAPPTRLLDAPSVVMTARDVNHPPPHEEPDKKLIGSCAYTLRCTCILLLMIQEKIHKHQENCV